MNGSLYRLVVRAGGIIGTAYALESAEIHIGRDAHNDIVIAEADISRRHARLTRQENGYVLEDLGSTNGTFVNGQRLTAPHPLRPGDEVRLGPKVVLVYEQVTDPNATVAVSAETLQAAPPAAAAPPSPSAPPPAAAAAPARPAPAAARPPSAPAKRKSAAWLLILIAALVFICVAVGVFLYFAPASFWCTVFPFLFPGAC